MDPARAGLRASDRPTVIQCRRVGAMRVGRSVPRQCRSIMNTSTRCNKPKKERKKRNKNKKRATRQHKRTRRGALERLRWANCKARCDASVFFANITKYIHILCKRVEVKRTPLSRAQLSPGTVLCLIANRIARNFVPKHG